MAPDPAKPAANPLRRDVDREVVQAWLDALSTQACDEQEFLRAVEKLTRRSPDAGWDALALLDQYYRLGKISTEVFSSLKSRLGSQLVGAGPDGQELSVPLPQSGELEPLPTPPTQAGAALAPSPIAPSDGARAPAAPAAASAIAPGPTVPVAPPPTAAGPRAVPRIPAAAKLAAVKPASRAGSGVVSSITPASPDRTAAAPAPAQPPPAQSAPAASAPPAAGSSALPSAVQAAAQAAREAVAPTSGQAKQAGGVEPLRRSTRREIAVGEVLRGRYVIKSVLGRGGTGMVFEAADLYRVDMPESGQRVALKVLYGQIASKPELLSELQREFQLLQSLSHPNIVRAYDLDRDGDVAFFTMEYLRGLSLTGVLAARNQVILERAYALAVIRDVGGAVAHAHSRAVVHGDLNPGNIFITNEGEIRVLDFGAAHVSGEGPTASDAPADRGPIATPRYASPQVLDGARPDARDDVYSLACIAYVLLTGKHPFGEKTALGAQEQRLRPSRPGGLSWKEWRALRAGLRFERERRPSDVVQWLETFDWSKATVRLPPLLQLVRVPARRGHRFAATAIGIAAVLAALAVVLWANAYFGETSRTPESAAGDSETQPSAPTQLTPPTPSTAAQPAPPAHGTAAQPAGGVASSSAPAPEASATPSPAPSSPANARTAASSRTAAGSRGAATSPSRAAPSSSESAAPTQSADAVPAGALPRSRVELSADTIEVPLTDPAARIVVRRRGSLQGDATFTWWTESGTAKPGQDFVAVAPHKEVIEDGKSSVNLFIPVVGDTTRRQPKSFYVVINDPGPGVTLGARTLTMVTIPPSQ